MIGADSTFIAPYGTMSISQNWRDDVKVGDSVDAMNKDKVWHTATISYID